MEKTRIIKRMLIFVLSVLVISPVNAISAEPYDPRNPSIEELIDLYYRAPPQIRWKKAYNPKVQIIRSENEPFSVTVSVVDKNTGSELKGLPVALVISGELADCYESPSQIAAKQSGMGLPDFSTAYRDDPFYQPTYRIENHADGKPIMSGDKFDFFELRNVKKYVPSLRKGWAPVDRARLFFPRMAHHMLGDGFVAGRIGAQVKIEYEGEYYLDGKPTGRKATDSVIAHDSREIRYDHLAKVEEIKYFALPDESKRAKVRRAHLEMKYGGREFGEAMEYIRGPELLTAGKKLGPNDEIMINGHVIFIRIEWLGGKGEAVFRPNDDIGDKWAGIFIQPSTETQSRYYSLEWWRNVFLGNVTTNGAAAVISEGILKVSGGKAIIVSVVVSLVGTLSGWFDPPYTIVVPKSALAVDARRDGVRIYVFEGSVQLFDKDLNPVASVSGRQMLTRHKSGATDGPRSLDTASLKPEVMQLVTDLMAGKQPATGAPGEPRSPAWLRPGQTLARKISPPPASGILDLSQAGEEWAREWTVISTMEKFGRGGKAGFYSNAVRSGDANPNPGREGILYLHPPSPQEPARLARQLTLGKERPSLRIGASGNRDADGDWALLVKVNGQALGRERIISGREGWQDLTFDLSPFSGQIVSIEIEGRANNWYFEYVFFDYIRVEGEAPAPFVQTAEAESGPAIERPAGAILMEETFDSENGGRGRLNYSSFAQWDVTEGTVDLIGNGFWDFYPDHRLYIDLDGSSNKAGTLQSKKSFSLQPGRYRLEFDLAGNPSSGPNTVRVSLGNVFSEDFTLGTKEPFRTISRNITVSTPGMGKLLFQHSGGDNRGLFLDNVKLNSLAGGEPPPGQPVVSGFPPGASDRPETGRAEEVEELNKRIIALQKNIRYWSQLVDNNNLVLLRIPLREDSYYVPIRIEQLEDIITAIRSEDILAIRPPSREKLREQFLSMSEKHKKQIQTQVIPGLTTMIERIIASRKELER